MSGFKFWSVLVVILLVAFQLASVRTEAWSEPVYTKPWTEVETTEQEDEDPVSEVVEETKDFTTQDGGVLISTVPETDDVLLNFENLYGTWYIWTPSTTTTVHAPGDGAYIGHEFIVGAEQGIIVISDDGTYSMSHAAWAQGEIVAGAWRLSYPREINGEVIQAIVLLDGITNVDWAVAPSPNGKMRLLWAMRWADGSATWVFDSEVVRE